MRAVGRALGGGFGPDRALGGGISIEQPLDNALGEAGAFVDGVRRYGARTVCEVGR
jgi:hypothetical protein